MSESDEIGWHFPRSNNGEEQSLNEPGIAQFSNLRSLGRETCQNIGDARHSDEPAIATFEYLQLPAAEFPGRQQYLKIFQACRKHVLDDGENTGNFERFFETGIGMLTAPTVPVLRIGDRNTQGLAGGDNERRKPFYRLLKMQGASSHQGPGGGTYGIGQRAPFAHSKLRAVLYSTKTRDGSFAFVGKSILASHPGLDGRMAQSKGWYGYLPADDDAPWRTIRQIEAIPERFLRSEEGTDLWVCGFDTPDWERAVRHSVLEHFFAAIQNDQLILELKTQESTYRIGSDNLAAELVRAADEAEEAKTDTAAQRRRGLRSTVYFHKALTSPYGGKPFEPAEPIANVPGIKLYVYRDLDDSQCTERWATMRLPRILVRTHGTKVLTRFNAVLICDSQKGNQYLAQMEDSKHEEWSVERARNWTHEERKAGKRTLNKIHKFVRDTLKSLRTADAEDEQDIAFLGQYLPADGTDDGREAEGSGSPASRLVDDETGHERSRDVDRPGAFSVAEQGKPSRITVTEVTTTSSGGKAKRRGRRRKRTRLKKPTTNGPGKLPGKSAAGEHTPRAKVLTARQVHFRSFYSGSDCTIVLRSSKDVEGDLVLRAVGEDSDFPAEVVSVSDLDSGEPVGCSGDRISKLKLVGGQTRRLRLTLGGSGKLCLAMEA